MMFYALNWFVVVALLAFWSVTAWALHAVAVWVVSSAGALPGAASGVTTVALPDWLAPWVPPEIAQWVSHLLAGLGPVIDSLAFYRRCRGTLAPSGVLVVNLFGEHGSYQRSIERIGQAFEGRLLALPPVPAGNVVLLAFQGPPLRVAWAALRRRAGELERAGLPARRWFDALRGQQGRFAEFAI